jgi:hypothetical protein
MKKAIFSRPDPYGLAPFTLLLPAGADISRLQGFTSSLFARYERVSALIKELESQNPPEEGAIEAGKLAAEEAMLKQVLDYLSLSPESNN